MNARKPRPRVAGGTVPMAYIKHNDINSPSLGLPPWLQLLPLDYLIRLAFTFVKDLLKSRLGQSPGLYEVLDYEAMLELRDAQGRQAVYKKSAFFKMQFTSYLITLGAMGANSVVTVFGQVNWWSDAG